MARIMIVNWGEKTLQVSELSKTLLRHLHDNGLDWMHACGAKGRCTTCKAVIVEGFENLSSLTPAENNYRKLGALKETERLACQIRITGDVVIAVPEETKLSHVRYE